MVYKTLQKLALTSFPSFILYHFSLWSLCSSQRSFFQQLKPFLSLGSALTRNVQFLIPWVTGSFPCLSVTSPMRPSFIIEPKIRLPYFVLYHGTLLALWEHLYTLIVFLFLDCMFDNAFFIHSILLASQGELTMSEHISGCRTEGCSNGIYWVPVKDASGHPIEHRTGFCPNKESSGPKHEQWWDWVSWL
jgi:hypothetical protein